MMMPIYSQHERFTLYHGDNREVLKTLEDNSIDSIVTDPPYELGFMGKSWDASGIAFNTEVWQECLRVLKPGGHLLAFSGSRTYHRMAVAIEDAGFEIRDQIMWIYGSGFPKSLDIAKSIEGKLTLGSASWNDWHKLSGELSESKGQGANGLVKLNEEQGNRPTRYASNGHLKLDPTTAEAKQWQGWGTALKPAHEPIVVARKPLIGTVAANVLTYGTGGLNIDASRVGRAEGDDSVAGKRTATFGTQETQSGGDGSGGWEQNQGGRWPANVIHDGSHEVVENLGEPQRFFYCAKASKRDRNEGLEGFEAVRVHDGREEGGVGGSNPRNRTNTAKVNHHPTVKPTDLMRYLCRLVTPPNGIVLDPFMGSGSTGKAAIYEGFNFVGIEMTDEYLPIAKARIEFAVKEMAEKLL
jgi:site-specific DNA-methyltransferase (adenine-specific)